MASAQVPTAMFVGKTDTLSRIPEAKWAQEAIDKGSNNTVIHYEEIRGGHEVFNVGKDMSYMSKSIVGLLQTYN